MRDYIIDPKVFYMQQPMSLEEFKEANGKDIDAYINRVRDEESDPCILDERIESYINELYQEYLMKVDADNEWTDDGWRSPLPWNDDSEIIH